MNCIRFWVAAGFFCFIFWVRPLHGIEHFSVYSRPNDDRFQNAAGATGEPYEVSRVRVSLETVPTGATHRLIFKWSASMTTGRHVESGAYFVLFENASTVPGTRTGRSVPLKITYPKGVTAQSAVDKKVGSLLSADLDLGIIEQDGTYSGELQIRNRGVSEAESNTLGITQLTGREASTFQTARWSLRVVAGQVRDVRVDCQRFAEPFMRLVQSNWAEVDPSRREHQPYPDQPKAARCKSETVGKSGESLSSHETEIENLTRQLAPLIADAGCLDCHAEGNENNFRFCDDGTPVYPETDAHNIFALITNSNETDWDNYPSGMRKAVERLAVAEKNNGLVSKWAFKHGVSPGLDFEFPGGVACTFDIHFRDLSGRVFLEADMPRVPIGRTLSDAIAQSCESCLAEMHAQKLNILRKSDGNRFMTYACILPRFACETRQEGVTYSVDKKALKRALASVQDPDAEALCRIE